MRNLAFKIKNEKVSQLLQALLFEHGYKWADSNKKIQCVNQQYLYLQNDEISYGIEDDWFNKRINEDGFLNVDLTLLELLTKSDGENIITIDGKKYKLMECEE